MLTSYAPAPMLAHLESRLPRGDQWRYEPKLDGFRGLLWHRGAGQIHLLSRNVRELGPWFPELVQAARQLPAGTLLDGEIVICDETGGSDFAGLQQRLSTARSRVAAAATERPAVLLVFDALEVAGKNLVADVQRVRRRELEQLLNGMHHPCLQLVEQTADVTLAEAWLRVPSLEGVVAKRADRPYVSGRGRDWVKIKRQRTVDCVVIGVAGDVRSVKLVLALRHGDGRLHHFAVSRPLAHEESGPVSELLREVGPEEPAIRSRWQHDAVPPWRPVPPRLVCEVRVTNLDAGRWARFPAAFLRWRPDRAPNDCDLEQLGQ